MREQRIILDGKTYIEGQCKVPDCTFRYRRPLGSYLKLCPLHLRRYKAHQSAERVRRHHEKKRAAEQAEKLKPVVATFR